MRPILPPRGMASPARATRDPSSSVLLALALPVLLSSLGTSMATAGLPTLARAFSSPLEGVQWVVVAYLLATTALSVVTGRLGDRTGKRRLLMAGTGLFTLASLMCALAPTVGWLILFRVLQGMGAAVMMSLTLALASGGGKTGRAMGLITTLSATGTALGPSLGGLLLGLGDWPLLFLVNVPLGLLSLLLQGLLPADPPPTAKTTSLDPAGMVLLVFTLTVYALAMTTGKTEFGPLNLLLLMVSLLGMAVFWRHQGRSRAPLLQPSLLGDPVVGTGFLTGLLVAAVVMATLVVGPFYLSGTLHLPALQLGLVMSCGPLVSALSGMPAGQMVDRFGALQMVLAGLTVMGVGTLLLSLLPASAGVVGYVLPLAVTTAGYALFQAANTTRVMAHIPPGHSGVVAGLLGLSRNLGLITGASLMGLLFRIGSSGHAELLHSEQVGAGFEFTFRVASGMVGCALLLAFFSKGKPARAG